MTIRVSTGQSAVVALTAIVASLIADHTAKAQPAEDRPRLVLNTQGPASRVRALAFSNDSARLFAGGFDKTVHVWDVGWNNQNGLEGPDRAAPIRTLRWEIARADKGLINTMAVAPGYERIAIGGVSGRGANGDIILMDTDHSEVEGSLPPVRDEQTHLPGHTQAVVSLNFSPDGRRLISSSSDGSVWLWTEQPGVRGNWIPTPIQHAPANPNTVKLFNERPVLFLSNELFVISQPIDDTLTGWRLALYSVTRPDAPLSVLAQDHLGRVYALARSADGQIWASADGVGNVFLWTVGPEPTPRVLRHGRQASAMAFGPGGQILAASNYLDAGNQSVVELWETGTGRLIDQVSVSSTEHTNAVAISPNGQFLATHADDTQDVYVYRLTTPDGVLLPDPFPAQPTIRLHSRAQRVTHVAFKQPLPGATPAYEIGFSTTPDRQILSDFNLSDPDVHRLDQPAPPAAYVAFDAFAGGWQATRSQEGSVVELSYQGNVVGRIPLDTLRQGVFEGYYCIIPDAQRNPFAIAIGTSNQNGIFVYSLPYQGRPTRLLRYFRDHNGEVLSVGVSHDARFLASGAEDQTVKIWSLEGLAAVSPTFRHVSAWGADFRLENGRVVVRNLMKMGIAFGRELRDGDVVAKLLVGKDELVNPVQIMAALDQRPLWEQMLFTVVRGGQLVPLKPTVPGWEPLMTLLVDTRGEWALFTPEGYYDASAAEGHTLFGWQINQGRNLTPRFLPGEDLQKEFERGDILRSLLVAGNMFDSLQVNNAPIPRDFLENIASKAAQVPEVKILRPSASEKFAAGQLLTIQAEVTTPPKIDPDSFELRTTLGGRFAGPPQQQQDQLLPDGRTKRTVTLQSEAPDELNLVKVEVTEKGETSILNSLNSSDKVFSRADQPPPIAGQPRYKLHFLALASDEYDGKIWPKLEYPKKDVNTIIETLYEGKEQTRLYDFGETLTLYNTLITPQNVTAYVQQILKSISPVGPKDVVLVYLSGHGKAINGEYYYIPPLDTADDEQVKKRAVDWPRLAVLGDAPCHVIWMLDTCQSGIVTDVKSGVRNVAKRGLVVAATSGNKDAFEGPQYRGGHGAFTASILDGLDGQADGKEATKSEGDDSKNGKVDIQELVQFVKEAVYQATGRNQEPCFTPEELVALAQIDLVKVASQPPPAQQQATQKPLGP